jgi:cytochrome c oxidase subunit 2
MMGGEIALIPEQASTNAERVDALFWFLFGTCGAVGLLVACLLIFFSVYYRRRASDSGPPPEIQDSRALEWFWTITPCFVFVAMFLWGASIYLDAFDAPPESLPVYVVAKQWMWKFQHPDGQRSINTLHIPVGRPVKLLLTSEDVIHSLFVPAFRIHMDVLPDRYTSIWFEATRAGEYHLFCSQYCGANHAGMIGKVVALQPADYQSWLNSHAEGSLALEGQKVFLKYRCISCHSADENARAPILENLYGRPVVLRSGQTVTADENYLRESMLFPGNKIVAGFESIMPSFQGQLDEDDVIALIAFIKALRPGQTPPRVERFPAPATAPTIEEEGEIKAP